MDDSLAGMTCQRDDTSENKHQSKGMVDMKREALTIETI